MLGRKPHRRGGDAEDDLRKGGQDTEQQWEISADAMQKQPKLGNLMDASREDVLTCMSFPREHWTQIAAMNPLERVNREGNRRSDVIGSFPQDRAIIRLSGALMLETNGEWGVARRYMSFEAIARSTDMPDVRLPAVAARSSPKFCKESALIHHDR